MAERTALITGASRGIGLGIARLLARKGFGLTLGARDPDRLAAVTQGMLALGSPEVICCSGDLADDSYSARAAATHRGAFGAMNCLVLNAGVGTAGDIATFPRGRFEKTVAVNFSAAFALLQESLPLLRAGAARDLDRGARIIALSSLTGVYPEPGLAVYGATKAALISLIATLNAEESINGISGTAIAPGYVETDMSAWAQDRIPGREMIPVEDVVRIAESLIDLSSRSVIPQIVMNRAGASAFTA